MTLCFLCIFSVGVYVFNVQTHIHNTRHSANSHRHTHKIKATGNKTQKKTNRKFCVKKKKFYKTLGKILPNEHTTEQQLLKLRITNTLH